MYSFIVKKNLPSPVLVIFLSNGISVDFFSRIGDSVSDTTWKPVFIACIMLNRFMFSLDITSILGNVMRWNFSSNFWWMVQSPCFDLVNVLLSPKLPLVYEYCRSVKFYSNFFTCDMAPESMIMFS